MQPRAFRFSGILAAERRSGVTSWMPAICGSLSDGPSRHNLGGFGETQIGAAVAISAGSRGGLALGAGEAAPIAAMLSKDNIAIRYNNGDAAGVATGPCDSIFRKPEVSWRPECGSA